MTIQVEKGKLHLIEVKIVQRGRHAIPSAGYSFIFQEVIPKRHKAVLGQKAISEAIKTALWEEWRRCYQVVSH